MAIHNGHSSPPLNRLSKDPRERYTREEDSDEKRPSHTWLWFILFVAILIVIVVLVLWHKHSAEKNLTASTDQMAVPTVLIIHPQKGDAQLHLTLPGTVDAQIESAVYAQVSGYIKRWLVDIGGTVKSGQLLAEIDTPVTDQQLKQAAESVKQAQANLDLAKTTANRYNVLLKASAVSQQDADNENASVKVQEANLSAAQAFESGIQKTEEFKQVKAPFDGVVTARQIDVGDYVSATGQTAASSTNQSGPSQTGAPNQELFRVAQIKMLRVYVNVPESYADQVRPGIKATLELTSAPNRTVTGKVVRTAHAIDPNSLTLLTEVDVDNPDETLMPGGYAQVHFDVVTSHPPMVIPGNSMLFRQQGPQVGIVDGSQKVHLQSIKIGRDLGTKLEVIDGLKPEDSVIVNPSDSLAEGQQVKIDTHAQPQ